MRYFLFPFAFIYGAVMWIRNYLFDIGVLKSCELDIPIIVVGNIRVGGTGKTPHVEYIINMLRETHKIAVISRGYKRKTRDIIEVTENSTSLQIGDEPKQIKQKFPDVSVIVSINRIEAIQRIMEGKIGNSPDVIILDDAFQYRSIKPGISILLTDYNNLIYNDYILPVGRLREAILEKQRANIVIVSKSPENLKPIEQRIIAKELNLYPYQKLMFSYLSYGNLKPLFEDINPDLLKKYRDYPLSILLVTGIANNKPLRKHIENFSNDIYEMSFFDHHRYSKKDLEKIKSAFNKIESDNKIIITTEKDSVRFLDLPDFKNINLPFFYIPVEICFLEKYVDDLHKNILSYISVNKKRYSGTHI